jgi:hypothetical protein
MTPYGILVQYLGRVGVANKARYAQKGFFVVSKERIGIIASLSDDLPFVLHGGTQKRMSPKRVCGMGPCASARFPKHETDTVPFG